MRSFKWGILISNMLGIQWITTDFKTSRDLTPFFCKRLYLLAQVDVAVANEHMPKISILCYAKLTNFANLFDLRIDFLAEILWYLVLIFTKIYLPRLNWSMELQVSESHSRGKGSSNGGGTGKKASLLLRRLMGKQNFCLLICQLNKIGVAPVATSDGKAKFLSTHSPTK